MVLFNGDEVKHAGQQQQSKKHTQQENIGWPPE